MDGMTLEQITDTLHTKGVLMDLKGKSFQDRSGRRLSTGEVLSMLPGATEDELAAWSKWWVKAARSMYVCPNPEQP